MAWGKWNPADKGNNVVISAAYKHIANGTSDGTTRSGRCDVFKDSGKYYVEFKTAVAISNVSYGLSGGVCDATSGQEGWPPQGTLGWHASLTQGVGLQKMNNNSATTLITDTGVSVGSVIQMAIDLDAGKVWFGYDDNWSGDPGAGTGEAFSGISVPVALNVSVNLWAGQSREMDLQSDPADQDYSAPSGFTAGWPSTIAEWSQSDKHPWIAISGTNNTIIDGTTGSAVGIRSDLFFSTGKKYTEFVFTDVTTTGFLNELGIATAAANLNGIAGGSSVAWVADITSGDLRKVSNNSGTVIISGSYGDGDILMVAVDLDAGKVWFGINGTWSGDPGAGTGEAYSTASISGNEIYLIGSQNSSTTGEMVSNSTQHTYSAPSGFTAGWGEAVGPTIHEASITASIGVGDSLGDNMGEILAEAGMGSLVDAFRDRSPIDATVGMNEVITAFRDRSPIEVTMAFDEFFEVIKEMFPAISFNTGVSAFLAATKEVLASQSESIGLGELIEGFNYSEFLRTYGGLITNEYHCTLTGADDNLTDVLLPLISLRGTSRTSKPTEIYITTSYDYLTQIEARTNGQLIIEMGFVYNGVEIHRETLIVVDFENFDIARPSSNQTITIKGSRTTTFTAKNIILTNINYDSYAEGRMRFRASIDPYLRPGDNVIVDDLEFAAGSVSYSINEYNQTMEIGEL